MKITVVTGLFAKWDMDVDAESPIWLHQPGRTLTRNVEIFRSQNIVYLFLRK